MTLVALTWDVALELAGTIEMCLMLVLKEVCHASDWVTTTTKKMGEVNDH